MLSPTQPNKKIYEVAKDVATRNLQLKLAILQSFVKNGVPWICDGEGNPLRAVHNGTRIVDFVPLNDRAFARWSTSDGKHPDYQNCEYVRRQLIAEFGGFTTHGPDSLEKRPEMKTLARALYTALQKRKREQELDENDSDRLTKMISERDHWKAAAEAAGAFVVQSLDKTQELEKMTSELSRALDEARGTLKDMEHQIDAKERETSLLKKQLSEISRLRRVQ